MSDPIKVRGVEKLKGTIKKLGTLYPTAFAGALYKLGVAIMADAIPRTPIEFGVLVASHYVTPPRGSGTRTNVELGFGTTYALIQHEGDFKHPRRGEQHYLANAVRAQLPAAAANLARWTRELVRSGQRFAGGQMPARPNVSGSKRNARLKRARANLRARLKR